MSRPLVKSQIPPTLPLLAMLAPVTRCTAFWPLVPILFWDRITPSTSLLVFSLAHQHNTGARQAT
ncbi:hypothetical protein Trco_000736 [Trichoderma cornu-damae]|uniref:Uncharacterized protein n=1 Tax=Trichoderma cornu-damae TaxID=654480 RepID=A0A9P8TWL7_9HYPO|nr:hypothetical protein Trco_000736 [Trichoderma cornu-damae]